MKIALIVPPFLSVPPRKYGGTELFVAQLAEGLQARGHHPVVYTVGDSRVGCEIRWRHAHGRWPVESELESSLDDLDHASWACRDAADCDLIHFNNASGLSLTRFLNQPAVYTLHHPHVPALSRFYNRLPQIHYVAISRRQAERDTMARLRVIPHGLDATLYRCATGARDYACFLGRITPEKGTHIAIRVARAAGVRLKIAGEIQPRYRAYWETEVQPHVDGHAVEYVGEVDIEGKNRLFAGARALLFPILWEEPFGLVMIEAMAAGVPVLAFARGAVPEVVRDGACGWICADAEEMTARLRQPPIPAAACRGYVEDHFGIHRMVDAYIQLYAEALATAPARHQPQRARRAREAA